MLKKRNSIEIFLDRNNDPVVKIKMRNKNSLLEIERFCALFFGLVNANHLLKDSLAFGLDKYLMQQNDKTLTRNVIAIINSLNTMNSQLFTSTINNTKTEEEEPIVDPES